MRRVLMTLTTTAALVARPAGVAAADRPANPGPSCNSGHHELRGVPASPGLRRPGGIGPRDQRPGIGRALVSRLAREHLGSIDSRRQAEG
jgi:hypothetical protein